MISYIYFEKEQTIRKTLNIIKKRKFNDDYILELPNDKLKTIRKLEKLLRKFNVSGIVCSDEIKGLDISKYNNITGKVLMNCMLFDILKYIFDMQGKKMELNDLYLLIKEDNAKYIENIKILSYYFKSINIITDNIGKFQKIVDIISKENGCLMYITNNTDKSLLRAKYIINFDLDNEELRKYSVNRSGIIINIKNDIKINNMSFNGICINSLEIELGDKLKEYFGSLINVFNKCQLYESIINQKQELEQVRKKIKEDEIEITYLKGNNGKIYDEEFTKILDKSKKLV